MYSEAVLELYMYTECDYGVTLIMSISDKFMYIYDYYYSIGKVVVFTLFMLRWLLITSGNQTVFIINFKPFRTQYIMGVINNPKTLNWVG